MNDRDTLIELLTDADMQRDDWDKSTYEAQADALLTAGWQAPRTSESACEDQNGHEFYDTCAYCGVHVLRGSRARLLPPVIWVD